MNIDPNIQSLPGWKSHVQSDGSNVGGYDPAVYSIDQTFPPSCRFFLQGTKKQGAYPTVDWYINRPIQANTGNLQLNFGITPNTNLANMALFETDLKLSIGGYTYNFSLQVLTGTWVLEISNQAGNWVSTGFKVPPFLPGVLTPYELAYRFNETTKLYSLPTAVINGELFEIPASLGNLTAIKTGWADGALIQQQRSLTPAAGNADLSASDQLDNCELVWS
jgi:hypothetical protein